MSESIRFQNYELLRREDGSIFELGRGAMGVTYKALDTDLHCHVALKVIGPGVLGSEEARERFIREARAAAKLHHPNIATVFRLGRSDDDTHFYAMEFCDGPTLEQALAARGPFAAGEALGIARQVCKALMQAEQHHLLHRDLKPSNLILTTRPDEGTVVKVIDFGLAKSLADGQQSLASRGVGGFVGTAHFASPEQLEEHDLDIRSDIYSLGVCLWFMLEGRPPFAGSLARVMSQALAVEPPWERLAGQPAAVIALLRRLLAKDREARPRAALALRQELDECLHAIDSAGPATDTPTVAAPPR
ncbi:MAG TPA: serine/threonine-protein kinase, partial [Chthoniobacteraceae bacterium]|nr:serine/threonine-protein kinase [Chthoniobacteraceae bacterium]